MPATVGADTFDDVPLNADFVMFLTVGIDIALARLLDETEDARGTFLLADKSICPKLPVEYADFFLEDPDEPEDPPDPLLPPLDEDASPRRYAVESIVFPFASCNSKCRWLP